MEPQIPVPVQMITLELIVTVGEVPLSVYVLRSIQQGMPA